MSRSIFENLELAPRDPILGITEAFNADTRPGKVNLGVGVYTDEQGKLPLLQAVVQAEELRVAQHPARGYLPIDGIPGYNQAAQTLLFGHDSAVLKEGRAATFQALGGTGALKIGADFLRKLEPRAQVWISDPSWENHRALFEQAGFTVNTYAYYDAATRGLNFAGMMGALDALPARSIVVLHACCHNPTGVDLTQDQWMQVVEVVKARDLIPFIDIAYQGFGDGIDADAAVVRLFATTDLDFFVSSSYSKSFSLYGERVGALTIVAGNRDESARVISQVKRTIRTNYSNPPTHGAAIVTTVLTTPALRDLWEQELAGMRERIRAMRKGLVERLKAKGVSADMSFMMRQRGMFSYSGLNAAQVARLRTEFGVYAVDSGRICVAALNEKNLDTVAGAIAAVL